MSKYLYLLYGLIATGKPIKPYGVIELRKTLNQFFDRKNPTNKNITNKTHEEPK